MPRWIISAGAVGCVLLLLIVAGTGTTNAMQGQTPQVITAQVGTVQPIGSGGTTGDVPPDYRPPYGLILTLRDDGRSFTVPVNSRIYLRIPRLPYTHLDYDPSILQEIGIYPVPYGAPQGAPGAQGGASQPATPMVAPGQVATGGPFPVTPMPLPPLGAPPAIMPVFGWQLIAVAPGTTRLALAATPCPVGVICPKMAIYRFAVRITVQGVIDVPPPVEPPSYPSTYADVYIGTAYLDQTIPVQVGQVVALDLPFLASSEPVTLSFDSAVLQPLPGQDLNHPQPGGWRFRVTGTGTTTILVQGKRCLDGSADCTPSLLFRVTVTTTPNGATGAATG